MSEETKTPNQEASELSQTEVELPPVSLEELDNLLNVEDPGFRNEFAVLQAEKFEVDIEVETFGDVQNAIEHPTSNLTSLPKVPHTNLFVAWVQGLVKGFKFFVHALLNFPRMSFDQKIKVLLILSFFAVLITVGVRSYKGSLLPSFELQFLSSFKKVADKSYQIAPGEPFEDFDNPLRHPEFVVLIERLVVNLRPSKMSDNPMGMFEFYIEASTQEGAIEINERQKELRDTIARALENFTYDELSGSEGKERAKLSLRRELNAILQNGRVRKVFFKTIILKPD